MTMPVKAQKVLLRMYKLSELGKLFPPFGDWEEGAPWSIATQSYTGCCNIKIQPYGYMCTQQPEHEGLHIAHNSKMNAVHAWVNKGEK